MMKPITMLLLFLAFAAGVSAQTKNPEELDQIKAEYQAQVKSTLDPINRKYLQQLDALKKQLGGKGDLDSALKVQKHIEEFSAKANMAPPGSKLYVPRNETVKQVNAPNPTLNAISEDDAIVFKDVGLPKAPNADSVQLINLESDAKNLSIGGLTADRLTECRRFASGRPRPENYDFTQDAFNAYVTSIPQDNRIAEEKRFKMVSGIKNYIVRLMERKTYDKPIKLKNGSTVSGGLMVNSNYISVKGKGNTFDRQGWNSIPVDQVANILDYFADLKLKASEDVNVSKSQQKLEAAEDYLRIGILCDWYGDYESAVKFARKAVATEPKIEESVKKYMMQ